MADMEQNIPILADSRMLSASIGKTYISASLLKAFCENGISLDTPISQWLSHFKWFSQLPNGEIITLRNILNHTSGLTDHVHMPEFRRRFTELLTTGSTLSTEELVSYVLDKETTFSPGEGWSYSDTGYLLAGLILDVELNQSWIRTVQDFFIFPQKLHMTEPSNKQFLSGLAVGYTSPANSLGLPERTVDLSGYLVWNPAIEGAGGGWVTTPTDLVQWGSALWSGKLFSERCMKEMLTGVRVSHSLNTMYGLGVNIEVSSRYGKSLYHLGWAPGYVSSLRHFPDINLTLAIQVNTDVNMIGPEGSFSNLEKQVIHAVFEGLDVKAKLY
jgi:D-alanyl-D-alanine carboxypeptidase